MPRKTLPQVIIWDTVHRPGVEAVVSFANLKIESALQADRALSEAAALQSGQDMQYPRGNRSYRIDEDGVWQPWAPWGARANISDERSETNYREVQQTLQRWLTKMSSWKKVRAKEKSTILNEIRPWIEYSNVTVSSEVAGDKLLRWMDYGNRTARQVIGESMYVLFEWGMVQEGGVAICPQCQSYFVKVRTDQVLCSNRCRQRKFRSKEAST
jgi:hypothetical protein